MPANWVCGCDHWAERPSILQTGADPLVDLAAYDPVPGSIEALTLRPSAADSPARPGGASVLATTASCGRFVWHELITADVERAGAFYCELFNWSFERLNGGASGLFRWNDVPVAGVAHLGAIGARTQWVGYVGVPDVERAARVGAAARGRIVIPPSDVPSAGRYAVLLDPSGAPITVWGSASPTGDDDLLGVFCWDELAVPSPELVVPFYQQVLGWTLAPFPGANDSWLFQNGPEQIASVVRAPPGTPPHWLSHVVVENLAAARSRVVRLGGRVDVAEQMVPGVGFFAVITDSGGARLALLEPRS